MMIFKAVLTLIIGGVDDVSPCTLLDCIEYISLQAHIAAIFLSKITSYHDFHTQLYTCSQEFDTLPFDYPIQLSATLLLPAAVFVMVMVSLHLIQHVYLGQSYDIPLAEKAYFLVQSLAFTLLAVLIMRLKLFLTPQLCLLTAILAKVKVSLINNYCLYKYIIILQFQTLLTPRLLTGVLLFGASFKGLYNLWHQYV